MPLLTLLVLFLLAPIMDQNSVQLKATVGGSIPIMCSLPGNLLGVQWFYWQEDESHNMLYHWNIDEGTRPVSDKYKNRVHTLNTEFSSGNISIRLDNVTVGDDGKKFWAHACVYEVHESFCTPYEKRCDSELQVSALYTDLHLTVNNTALVATCTARGGYPEPQVSWTGQSKSSGEHLDLQDAETSMPQDSTEGTFSLNSFVSVKELQSVTCIVYNPRCNQKISKTSEVDAPDENQQRKYNIIFIPVIISIILFIVFLCVFLWRKRKSRRNKREEAVRLSEIRVNRVKLLQTDKDTTAAGADAEARLSTDIEEHATKKSPQKEAEM